MGPTAEEVIASEDPFGREIIRHESSGRAAAGWGGKKDVDLSDVPLDAYGFPDWKGNPGPVGVSTAAGLYGITKTNWHHYAPIVGVKDFSPASQKKVKDAILADQGRNAWVPYWGGPNAPGYQVIRERRRGGSGAPASTPASVQTGSEAVRSAPNALAPPSAGAGMPAGAPVGALPKDLVWLALAAGLRFTPISGDPFKKALPRRSSKRPSVPSTPDISIGGDVGAAAAPRARVATPYVARTGMRQFYQTFDPRRG